MGKGKQLNKAMSYQATGNEHKVLTMELQFIV